MEENNNKSITEKTAKDLLLDVAKKPAHHIKNSQILAGIFATVGLITFALGIENLINSIPQLSSPFVEIVIGIVMLSVSGLFLKKLI